MDKKKPVNWILQYRREIKAGRIVAGKWIHKVYDYLADGLRKKRFFYAADKADLAIDFIQRFCHHSEGRDDLLTLELWQKAATAAIFGIVDADGYRVFREVFLVVARKNGKTLFASALEAYVLFLDREYGAKIFCLAPKLEQAEKTYDGLLRMLDKEPALAKYVRRRRTDLYMASTNSSVKPLPFNSRKSDGFNPHLTVCDEISSWPAEQGLKQYEVMKSALGSRKQPLILSISTSGYINDGPFDELMARSTALLQGTSGETRLLPLIYQIDDIAKWDDLTELRKSNPNLGVSVSENYYREEIEVARNSLSKRAEFLTKYCNIKQASTTAWLPYEIVDAVCGEDYTLDDFRDCYCVGGIDLSQTTDLTACCIVVEREGVLYVVTQFFMPANKIDELSEREGVPYKLFVAQGLVTPSGENFVDYRDCFNWFRRLVEDYGILPLKVGYDRYSAQYLIQDMTAYGFHCDDVYQGENLTPVIKECDGLLRDERLKLGKNNLLKAHFLSVGMKQNEENRKVRPVKIEQRAHIDGFVAVIDALTVRQKWAEQIGDQLKNS